MSWVREFQADTSEFLCDPCLPRRLLRHLIVAPGSGPGSRVLVVGCERSDVLRFFDRLGLAVTGLDDSSAWIEAARSVAPNVEFVRHRPESVEAPVRAPFDVAIVWASALAYGGNLFSPAALQATARWLAWLRPGGHLILLARFAETDKAAQHDPLCFRRHLAHFPGTVDEAEFPDRGLPGESLRRMLGRTPAAGYLAATLSLSQSAPDASAWRRIAETAARESSEPCCAQCLSSAAKPSDLSAA